MPKKPSKLLEQNKAKHIGPKSTKTFSQRWSQNKIAHQKGLPHECDYCIDKS